MKNIFKNRRAFSTGFTFIYGLISLFGIGVMYIIFTQVFDAHLTPLIKTQINDSTIIEEAVKAESIAGINKYMSFFHALPYILFLVIIVYMLVAAFRKEQENQYL